MPPGRKELFLGKLPAGSRTYFFDIKESADGTKYLVISEAKRTKEKAFEHNRVMVFGENIPEFCRAFGRTVKILQKEI